jgi:hypothetical protein
MMLIPFVVKQEGRTDRDHEIYSRLHLDRIIFIGRGSEVDRTASMPTSSGISL